MYLKRFILSFIFAVVFGVTTMGASFNHEVVVSTGSGWDSALVRIDRDGVNQVVGDMINADTTLALDDIYQWTITKTDFWNGIEGEGYPDPPVMYHPFGELYLKLDTLNAWMGYGIGNKSHTDYDSDNDTIWVVLGNDTIGIIQYFHPSGVGGQSPDSVKALAKP